MGGFHDVLEDAFEVAHHLLCGDTERADALGSQPGIAGCVALGAVAIVVRFAVDFYGQFEAGAEEVEDIGSGGVLVAEAQSVRAFLQLAPQSDLGQAHRVAQLFCALLGFLRAVQHLVSYPSTAFGGPPPPPGEDLDSSFALHFLRSPNP